jgi:4-hydroxybenzoate polyprenyltransferase
LNLLLLGFAAAMFTLASEQQLFTTKTFQLSSPTLFNFFATICSYAVMRSRIYLHPGEKPSEQNRILQLALIAVTAIVSAYFLFQLSTNQILKIALLATVSGAYFLPIVKTKTGWKRLRDFYHIKHFVVGAMWALATVLLISENYTYKNLWILFAERTFFVASLSLLFDHRDLQQDTDENHQTIVKIKGWQTSHRLSFLLMLLAACAALYLPIEHSITIKKISVISLSAICIQLTKPDSPSWWYNVVMESLMVIFAVVSLL